MGWMCQHPHFEIPRSIGITPESMASFNSQQLAKDQKRSRAAIPVGPKADQASLLQDGARLCLAREVGRVPQSQAIGQFMLKIPFKKI